LCTAVPFFVGATWRLPDTYHSAGLRWGTATSTSTEIGSAPSDLGGVRMT
jgi:hypothetical protein